MLNLPQTFWETDWITWCWKQEVTQPISFTSDGRPLLLLVGREFYTPNTEVHTWNITCRNYTTCNNSRDKPKIFPKIKTHCKLVWMNVIIKTEILMIRNVGCSILSLKLFYLFLSLCNLKLSLDVFLVSTNHWTFNSVKKENLLKWAELVLLPKVSSKWNFFQDLATPSVEHRF